MTNTTDQLIINSPYDMPQRHLQYMRDIKKFEIVEGRRPAGYIVASESSKTHDDPGVFVELPLVNKIRERIDVWRSKDYPGIISITRKLLEHWRGQGRDTRFFFCQLEAIETLIWLVEGPESGRQGMEIPNDSGEFQRICSKMTTGTGKTFVMAMLIAWRAQQGCLSKGPEVFKECACAGAWTDRQEQTTDLVAVTS